MRFWPTFVGLALAASALLGACGDGASLGPGAYRPVSGPAYKGVIVPAVAAGEFGFSPMNGQAPRFWTPTPADVEKLEAGVERFLARTPDPRASGIEPLERYRRQYAGIDHGAGPLVYANFFCESAGVDWTKKPVVVYDGGPCFFKLFYDPRSGRYSELSINGEA